MLRKKRTIDWQKKETSFQRQFYCKCTAATFRITDRNLSVMRITNLFGNGKPQSEMFFVIMGFIALVKFIKDFCFIYIGNTYSSINYLYKIF